VRRAVSYNSSSWILINSNRSRIYNNIGLPYTTTRYIAYSKRIISTSITCYLETPKPFIHRISQGHSLYQISTLWDYSFLIYAPGISVKNALIDHVILTFDLSTPKPYHFNNIPSLNTMGSFVFELCCEQRDRQTDGPERPTHALRLPTAADSSRVGVGN